MSLVKKKVKVNPLWITFTCDAKNENRKYTLVDRNKIYPIFRDVGIVVSIPLQTAKCYILLEETVNKSDLLHVLELKINLKGTYN